MEEFNTNTENLLGQTIDGFKIVSIELGGVYYIGEKDSKKYVLSICSHKCTQLTKGYDDISLTMSINEPNAAKYCAKATITSFETKVLDLKSLTDEYRNSLNKL